MVGVGANAEASAGVPVAGELETAVAEHLQHSGREESALLHSRQHGHLVAVDVGPGFGAESKAGCAGTGQWG